MAVSSPVLLDKSGQHKWAHSRHQQKTVPKKNKSINVSRSGLNNEGDIQHQTGDQRVPFDHLNTVSARNLSATKRHFLVDEENNGDRPDHHADQSA